MERRGNNGTTAFDFEFNLHAPDPANPLVPNRVTNDVLFTFEMSGSGSSGSAVPHYFLWSGSNYVEQIPAPSTLISSINQTDIPAAPWGYVNSKGNWVLGNLLRFEFAEASVALTQAFPMPRTAVSYIMDTFPIVRRKDEDRAGLPWIGSPELFAALDVDVEEGDSPAP